MQQKEHLKKYAKIHLNRKIKKSLKNISNKKDIAVIAIFIPHKGCKNECVFCNQVKISGIKENVNINEIEKQIQDTLKQIPIGKKTEIAFFGGSFTGIDIEEQKKYLELANKYIKSKKIDSIRISTRPDYISEEILKMLKKYNVKTIELGVQSMDDEVLKTSKRGHTKQDVIQASNLIHKFKIRLGHQIMVGLPKSTVEKEINTIKESIKLKPADLRIYPVYVLEESELFQMFKSGVYTPLTLEDAYTRVYEVLKYCINKDINVIRIGLQSTEEITINNTKVIGPVCDNFAEYAFAKIVRDIIEEKIRKIKASKVEIQVPKRYLSIVSGPKKINKIFFKEKYNIDIILKGVI